MADAFRALDVILIDAAKGNQIRFALGQLELE